MTSFLPIAQATLLRATPPIDHCPSPLAELRLAARGEDRLPGFGEEELHVLPPLAIERLVGSAFLPGAILLVPGRVERRRESAVGRKFRGLREPVRILDGRIEGESPLVVDAVKLHEGEHPGIGKDDLGDLPGKVLLALEEPVVVLQQRLELLLGEAADLRLGNHRAKCGGLGLAALDRELVPLAAADVPDPVRDARHLLRRVAVGEQDVSVFRVLVGRGPDELVDVALDVGERQVSRVHDVADLPLALLVRDGV